MILLRLALASALNRRQTLMFTLISIALGVALLLGVERLRETARESFSRSISGTDLVVGARTSPVQLMLYSVFRLGDATNNIRWQSYLDIARLPAVAWTIPLSLGDSHNGFAVLGTTGEYFKHFQYGDKRTVEYAKGQVFVGLFDAVLGAEVAERMGYDLKSSIILSHGSGEAGLPEHADKPFTVVGILKPTGTPVDRTIHVSLEAIEAIHLGWQAGVPMPGLAIPAEFVRKFDLNPKEITAVLVGLKSRTAAFQVQREVNGYQAEPLLAVLPGVALDALWRTVSVLERTLFAISALVVIIGLSGMVATVMANLGVRRRELAILRSVGAGPVQIVGLLVAEGALLMAIGAISGYVLLTLVWMTAAPLAQTYWGITLDVWTSGSNEALLLLMVFTTGIIASLLPAWQATRLSLADGLTPRL